VEPNSLGEKMAYQILAFIILGLVVMCVGFNEEKGSMPRDCLVAGAVGWIICSLLFPAINSVISKAIW